MAVWGRSDESGAAPALWPWLAPLRALIERVADPSRGRSLTCCPARPASHPARPASQFERFEAVADCSNGPAPSVPVVVLLDDLQWADVTSLKLLALLAERPRPRGARRGAPCGRSRSAATTP